jgi:hypothetical protein
VGEQIDYWKKKKWFNFVLIMVTAISRPFRAKTLKIRLEAFAAILSSWVFAQKTHEKAVDIGDGGLTIVFFKLSILNFMDRIIVLQS